MKRAWPTDDKEHARGGWTRNDARAPSAAYGPLRLRPAMLKRRSKKLYTALALGLVYVTLQYLGLLGYSGGGIFFGGGLDDGKARPDTRSWLNEKWLTNVNQTSSRADSSHTDKGQKDEMEWYGDREGSSELIHGLLQGPGERANAAAINIEHLQNWLRFTWAREAYDGDDRISFANMAFQTSTYARLLRHIDEVPGSLLQEFEEKLWYFIPGLEKMRIAHNHVAREPQVTTSDDDDDDDDAAATATATAEAIQIPQAKTKRRNPLRRIANRLKPRRLQRRDFVEDSSPPPVQSSPNTDSAAAADTTDIWNRGIVTVAGDGQMQFVVQLLAIIRDAHHCDIPVEVYYNDDDDLSEDNRAYLEATFAGVRTISLADLQLFEDDFSSLAQSSYSMRSFALLATNFTAAMLVDADTVFTIDPHDFFAERGYGRIGTLFFRDMIVHGMKNIDAKNFVRDQLGRRKPSEQLARTAFWRHELAHLQDSGVLVVNKANPNVFAALVFSAWQNSAWVREQLTYQKFFGDKETYWLAFELAGLPYHFSPHEAGAIGAERSIWTGGFCAEHQLHLLDTLITHTHTPSGEGHGEGDERYFVSTSEKHELQKSRVAWWNGSLMKSRQRGLKFGDLDAHSTVWALDGRWAWQGDNMCLTQYTRRNAQQLGIKPSLEVLLDIGKTALLHLTG